MLRVTVNKREEVIVTKENVWKTLDAIRVLDMRAEIDVDTIYEKGALAITILTVESPRGALGQIVTYHDSGKVAVSFGEVHPDGGRASYWGRWENNRICLDKPVSGDWVVWGGFSGSTITLSQKP